MSAATASNTPVVAPETKEAISARFVAKVEQQFKAELGTSIQWSDLQRALAQHLFIRIDNQLQVLDAKRGRDAQPITWANVNMPKLAVDAVHRVSLELDALIPNTINPTPRWNTALQKYDLDLGIGYMGMDYSRRKFAVDPPKEVTYMLVYETDEFMPHPKDMLNKIESYTLKRTNPFNPGKVVGGFGYISFDDPAKNRLIIVTDRDFQRARNAAPTKTVWDANEVEMKYKTVVHRTTAKIALDPAKVNAVTFARMQLEALDSIDAEFEDEATAQANGQIITLPAAAKTEEPQAADETDPRVEEETTDGAAPY